MKTPLRLSTWLWSLIVTSGLFLLGAPGTAQDNNPPAADPQSKPETATNEAAPATVLEDAAGATNTAASEFISATEGERSRKGVMREAIVVMGKDVELKADDSAEAVVVIGGSARIRGYVREAVVAVGGDITIEPGAEVRDAVVAVMGGVKVAPGGTVHNEVVSVGGKVDVADGAKVGGRVQEIDFGGIGLPRVEWLRAWFHHCVLKLRPLAPQVGWVWGIAGGFLLLYLLIALAFPRPVLACVNELTRRPATTFLMGLLTKLLMPVVLLILIATGIGVFVAPFVIAALVLGALVGKTALLEALGLRLASQFGGPALKPLLALLLGALIIALLYMVPVLGLLMLGVTSIWGLGGAVTAAFGGLRREMPEKPATPPPGGPGSFGVPVAAPLASVPGSNPGHFAPDMTAAAGPEIPGSPSAAGASPFSAVPSAMPATAIPPLPDVLAYPKAGFWERMGAAFLDVILVSIFGALVGGAPLGFLVALAYFAGMWTWKATTVGGIVLGLKVARMDGQPVTFAVALIRALGAAFSIVVLFLGFLWIAWDKDKQGWHDKIAGTVVLRLPRGTPLVCF